MRAIDTITPIKRAGSVMKQLTKKQYEALEIMHLIIAGILLLAGLGMMSKAFSGLIEQENLWQQSLEFVDMLMTAGIVLLVLGLFWVLKDLRGIPFSIQFWGRAYPFQDNSYMENSVTHAMHYSWFFSIWSVFVCLALLKYFPLPQDFYLRMVGAVMLVSWSTTYFYRYLQEARQDGDEI